ncbi:phage late control D protein [Ostertagia ostertagi]
MAWALSLSQRGFTPALKVTVDGKEVASGFYNRLIDLRIRDEAGQKADSLTAALDDAGNVIDLPREKARIEVWGGYLENGLFLLGIYELQTISIQGSADGGERIVLQASAADLKRKLKGKGREAFENKTLGEIVDTIAQRNGMEARVSADLREIQIPYRARVDASEIDFLTTLGDQYGAVVKPMGDKLVMAKLGEAKAASGKDIPPIQIEKGDCVRWNVDPRGRPQYGKVRGAYIDQDTGKREITDANTGMEGPDFTIRDPFPSKEQAEKGALAEARRLTRNTGDGDFELALGRPEAQAEADVIAGPSFRTGIAGNWRAEAAEHVFDDNGYRTKVEIKANEDGSSEKNKQASKGSK